MRGVLLFAALGLVIAGCATDPRIDPQDRSRGVVILGLSRASDLDSTPFYLDLRPVDRSNRVETPDRRSHRRALATLPAVRMFRPPPETRFAFALDPGEYVVARIGIDIHDLAADPYNLSGIDPANRLVGLGLALLIREGQEASEGEPIRFVHGNEATAAAPRFTVRPGEVLYIGDVLIGAEIREVAALAPPSPDEKNRYGGTAYRQTRLFAEALLDEPGARTFAGSLGVGRWPFRSEQIRLSDSPRTMFPNDAEPPKDAARLRVVVARPELSRSSQAAGGRSAPSLVPTASGILDGVSDAELRRRFLAGEISVEQYRAAMAARH